MAISVNICGLSSHHSHFLSRFNYLSQLQVVSECHGFQKRTSNSVQPISSSQITLNEKHEVPNSPRSSRRSLLLSSSTVALTALLPSSAWGLGDTTITLEDVTREVTPAGPLPPGEAAVVDLFEKSTYSVVNIFDVTLRPQVNITGSVEVPEGNGSGFIWSDEGYIVTNYHVIGNSLALGPLPGKTVARVTILGNDGYQRNFEGKLIGADKYKDLAVLQVSAPPGLLRPLPIGQSDRLRVGQRCFAIGNPFGFDHTLTAGVLSGLDRDIFSQTGVIIAGGVQTDAAINPGNSGGPLLDSSGRVIGINTAIFTRTGTSAGVGFAIPIQTVQRVVPQLIAFGKVSRPGINVQLAADRVASQLNVISGALVLGVPPRSAAERAGIMATRRGFGGNIILGDIIISIEGNKINSTQDIGKVLDKLRVGDEVTVDVLRGDEVKSFRIKLEESPS